MSVKRIVSTDFWTDEKVSVEFSRDEKLFLLYLLTNPHTTQLGIYKILPRQIAFEVGCTENEALSMLDKFENKYGIIKYSHSTKEVAIRNYLNYSIVKGGRPVFDLLVKEALNVKDIVLLEYIKTGAVFSHNDTVRSFVKHIGEGGALSFQNDNYNGNDNGNDNEESYNESSQHRRGSFDTDDFFEASLRRSYENMSTEGEA